MKMTIGIDAKQIKDNVKTLSVLLADEHVLYTKTRNAHWNITGADFHAMHVFFESQYDEIEEIIDEVAERIRQLGEFAPASLKEFLQLSNLLEKKIAKNDSQTFVKVLLEDHESVIKSIRNAVSKMDETKDFGTEDFLVGLLEKHEKMAWMLRAHLSK
ncbi:DNA starvation/stationary phase protection protein [Soonwooa sp.]|uniref:Dps family protein n=1 Tax=Soonwooa sp. TaxID=1938592 RepID=UPI00262F297C|nr:DNA starvation/stationary phase protection protein [Soonwooa sp.]